MESPAGRDRTAATHARACRIAIDRKLPRSPPRGFVHRQHHGRATKWRPPCPAERPAVVRACLLASRK
ncbi:hypothetical protein E2562_021336 [Oryza meyeriana var. granulata]|uniref:Uncharacterized protein n=1 Tax=Oryza meyeriana var. granulata TaxID=110450 RepID=A0A6G1C0F2_9ORYZ|nr:hypothetical protein E2562_021336 [Oryza meyeriana var. granulata]